MPYSDQQKENIYQMDQTTNQTKNINIPSHQSPDPKQQLAPSPSGQLTQLFDKNVNLQPSYSPSVGHDLRRPSDPFYGMASPVTKNESYYQPPQQVNKIQNLEIDKNHQLRKYSDASNSSKMSHNTNTNQTNLSKNSSDNTSSSVTPSKTSLTSNLNWTLDDFEIGIKLGEGKFGRVYLAREKAGRRTIIAIKAIKKDDIKKEKIKYQLVREIELQKHLHHFNIPPT